MAGDERYDLWRKQGFICKPYSGEISDGTRFISEYMEQAQKYSADDDWMEDDVLLGKDQGGDDPAAPAIMTVPPVMVYLWYVLVPVLVPVQQFREQVV